jgi:hypothetical protein
MKRKDVELAMKDVLDKMIDSLKEKKRWINGYGCFFFYFGGI